MLMVLPRKIKVALAGAAKAVGAAVRKGLADVAEAMWLVVSLGLWLHGGRRTAGREHHGPFRQKLGGQPGGDGPICSGPPPLMTVIEAAGGRVGGDADRFRAAVGVGGQRVRAAGYGQPAGPPSVLTVSESGAAVKTTCALPPSVVMLAVAAARPWATSGPPEVSAPSGPVSPSIGSGPPPVTDGERPADPGGAAPGRRRSRGSAPATPETVIGPPSVATVTVTSGGTVTVKLTLQSGWHAGRPG